jgi:hypothetical protein
VGLELAHKAQGDHGGIAPTIASIISIVRGKKPGFSEKPGFSPFKPQVIERIQ